MKKRWLALALTVPLVLGACSKDEEKVTEPKTQQEDKKGMSEAQEKNLALTHQTSIQNDKLTLAVTLENKNNEEVTLAFEKGNALDVIIRDQNGNVFDKVTLNVEGDNSLTLGKGKTYAWKYSGDLNKQYGTYSVTAVAHLKDKDGNTIDRTHQFDVKYAQEEVEKSSDTATTEYQPSKAETLVYQNNDGSGNDINEEYLYFGDGYTQAYNSMIGGNVIYYTDATGYYRVYTDTGSKKGNIIDQITPKKEMLVKLPAKKGDTWKTENITYVTENVNATIKTAYGDLSDVVVVSANMGQKVRFYYHPDYGMVKTEVEASNGNYQSLYELKSIK
ncbi:hypothetical protein CN918_28065 [Priestia megaterium]|nr:hypothetical protein CN918_28065 [Priestia megaterium]